MPLLTDHCIELIKERSSERIVELLSECLPLKRASQNWECCCPFHEEKSPSFKVSIKKLIYKCFGCGQSGDTLQFFMKHLGITFMDAVVLLAGKLGIPLEHVDGADPIPAPIGIAPIGGPLSSRLTDWFQNERGITTATLQQFGITEAVRWMPKARKETATICFPYIADKILLNYKFRAASKDFGVVKGAPLTFFNLDAVAPYDSVIIVEGEIDVLSFHQCGFENVVSVPNGSDRTSFNHAYPFLKDKLQFFLAGDSDSVGQKLQADLIGMLGATRCMIVPWKPGCKDANATLKEHGPQGITIAMASAYPVPVISIPELVDRSTVGSFPLDILHPEIAANFKELSEHYSIPVDYLGTTALFSVAALSGTMFQTELNGSIKNIIYAMLVGPSGVGKTPAYNLLCGDIIEPNEKRLFEEYEVAKKEWDRRASEAKAGKQPFDDPKPILRTRMAKGGTMEGIQRHAMYSAAGFGLYYDEGGKMIGSPNAYKKETSSTDFWNETWNGKSFYELRADESRERYFGSTAISALIGMQPERMSKYFNMDSIESGLTARFLITTSDSVQFNEHVDHFGPRRTVSDRWKELIRHLFDRGAYNFFKDDSPTRVTFDPEAAALYNGISSLLIRESNENNKVKKKGETSSLMTAYDSKLYAYLGRFILLLSIMDDAHAPFITKKHVINAEKLYRFYRGQAYKVFTKLNKELFNDMSESCIDLYNILPDSFTTVEARKCCERLNLTEKYFDVYFDRIFNKKGLIKRLKKGEYYKVI